MDLATLTLREFAAQPSHTAGAPSSSSKVPARATLRRCRTREQGIGLMTVGHAIEYLVQSRLIGQKATTGAEREALAILLNANLAVYNEGTEVVPLLTRLRRWFHGSSPMKHSTAVAQ